MIDGGPPCKLRCWDIDCLVNLFRQKFVMPTRLAVGAAVLAGCAALYCRR